MGNIWATNNEQLDASLAPVSYPERPCCDITLVDHESAALGPMSEVWIWRHGDTLPT